MVRGRSRRYRAATRCPPAHLRPAIFGIYVLPICSFLLLPLGWCQRVIRRWFLLITPGLVPCHAWHLGMHCAVRLARDPPLLAPFGRGRSVCRDFGFGGWVVPVSEGGYSVLVPVSRFHQRHSLCAHLQAICGRGGRAAIPVRVHQTNGLAHGSPPHWVALPNQLAARSGVWGHRFWTDGRKHAPSEPPDRRVVLLLHLYHALQPCPA